MNRIPIILIFLLAFSACDKEETDNNIDVKLGNTFTIDLHANWSTGYHWYWSNKEQVSVADSVDMEFIPDNPDMEGSSGVEEWTFLSKSKGEDILQFAYVSPGGDPSTASDEKEFIVTVN